MRSLYAHPDDPNVVVEVFEERDAAAAILGPNDILVQVQACSVTRPSLHTLPSLQLRGPASGQAAPAGVRLPASLELCGTVHEIGRLVSRVAVGDVVAGLVPPLSSAGEPPRTACSEQCLLSEYDVVRVPAARTAVEAAAAIGDSVRAYTALHYQGRVVAGDTVVVLDGASSFGCICIQLALHWGAKVITTVHGAEERAVVERLHPAVAQVIDNSTKNLSVVSAIIDETGGLGADVVIDNGARLAAADDMAAAADASKGWILHKHDVISSLAVGGRWVTSQRDLQLDPPDSERLFLKGCCVCFLFEFVWPLSRAQEGRYHHILTDVMEKLGCGVLRPNVRKVVQFKNAEAAFRELPDRLIGKVVMTM